MLLTSRFHCYMMKMLSSGEVLPLFRWCKDKSWGLQVSELSVLQWIHSVCVFYHLFIFLEGRISCTVLVRRHFHKCVRGSGTTVTLTLIMCWWLWWPSSPSQRLRAGQRKTIVHTHSHSNTHTQGYVPYPSNTTCHAHIFYIFHKWFPQKDVLLDLICFWWQFCPQTKAKQTDIHSHKYKLFTNKTINLQKLKIWN